MRTIHRYEIPVDGQPHKLVAPFEWSGLPDTPAGRSCIVHVAARLPDAVEVWAQVDTDLSTHTSVTLQVTGTGRPAPEGGAHIGSALAPLNAVWHLWRVRD